MWQITFRCLKAGLNLAQLLEAFQAKIDFVYSLYKKIYNVSIILKISGVLAVKMIFNISEHSAFNSHVVN